LNETGKPVDTSTSLNRNASHEPFDKVSPQAIRFPVPPRPLGQDSDDPSSESPASTASLTSPQTTRQYLSLQQLTSETEKPSLVYSRATQSGIIKENRQLGLPIQIKARNKNSLENRKNLTAHFVGLSGEQDTNLLPSIRYNVLNETKFIDFNIRQVYAGDPVSGTPPIHFSIFHDIFLERD
jgi:hypothetical protein